MGKRGWDEFERVALKQHTLPNVKYPKITIDRGKVQPVIQWKQDKGNYKESDEISDNHPKIGALALPHISRNRHECDSGKERADHTIGNSKPG